MADARSDKVVLLNYNEDERELYGDALDRAGYDVTTITDPEEAVELALAFPPRVFITSLVQPRYDVDGIELTRRIKNDPRTRHTAVVITTTMIESSYHEAAVAAGCDAYLLLPVLPDELVGTVRRLLRPQREERPRPAHVERRRLPRRQIA